MKDKRSDFITDNIGLVHSVANRFRNRGADYDDLFQAGCIGLIKAADNFDESRGFQFSTYAVPVIMGEIKRCFRDGGQIKISRSLKEKSVHVQYERDKFINKYQREPTVSELSEITNTEVNELCEVLNILSPVVSLSINSEDGDEEYDIPFDDSDKLFDKIALHQAIDKLSYKEKLILHYRFFSGKTQVETAKNLGLSQVQISRKEKEILSKLREYLK